jgi:uncharacterized protein YoxC
MEYTGVSLMAKNTKPISFNWEKISVYLAALALVITLWASLNETQRDISDIKERIARLEVKVDKLEEKK